MNNLFFTNQQNKQMKLKDLEGCIFDRFSLVQTNYLELIPSSVK